MLDKIDEMEFISRIHLPRITKHPIGLNFECYYCKEGKSAGRKRRGFILTNSRKYDYNVYYCQNCGISISFKSFLKDYNYSLYEEYLEKERTIYLKKIKDKQKPKKTEITQEPPKQEDGIKYFQLLKKDGFIPAREHKETTKYCLRRKVPLDVFKGFYYNKAIKVESGGKMFTYRNMLVMPFYDGEKIYGYQARSLRGKTFYTCSTEGYKVYNFFNVDLTREVYICESILDSVYIPNSIAMIGASLSSDHRDRLKYPVYVFDNDVSKDTINRMTQVVEDGFKVVIWPDEMRYKDINEAIVDGMTPEAIKEIIDENTFEGFSANTRLSILRSRKKRR